MCRQVQRNVLASDVKGKASLVAIVGWVTPTGLWLPWMAVEGCSAPGHSRAKITMIRIYSVYSWQIALRNVVGGGRSCCFCLQWEEFNFNFATDLPWLWLFPSRALDWIRTTFICIEFHRYVHPHLLPDYRRMRFPFVECVILNVYRKWGTFAK